MKNLLKFCWIWMLLIPIFSQGQTGLEEDSILFMDIPVVTSTLSEKKLSEAPSNMTVISASEIEAMGCQTLLDILKKTEGVIVTRTNIGIYLISLRGISSKLGNDKIKLLLNGHTIADPMKNSFTFFFNISADNIKQVEILRGPGSCLYGTNAFSGIINVITKKSDSGEASQITLRGGSDNSYRTNYNFSNKPGENQELNLNADYSKTDGPDLVLERDQLYGAPFSAAPAKMDEYKEESRVYGDYHYENFSLMASYSDVETGLPIGRNFMTQEHEKAEIQFRFIEAKYDLKFSDTSLVTLKISGDWWDYASKGQYFPYGTTLFSDTNGDGIQEPLEYFPSGAHGEFGTNTREYRTELLWKYTLNDSNQLLIGTFYEDISLEKVTVKADFHPLYYYRLSRYTDLSDSTSWVSETKRKISGAFFQDEWNLSEDYYLLLSGRYDKYNDFGSSFNPRGGLVWTLSEKTHVKLMYGTAFKAPTFNQLYPINNPVFIGNPDLDAEELESYEVNISHMFAEKLHGSLTLFKTEIENLIDLSQDPYLSMEGNPVYYMNYSKTEIYGVEAEIRCYFSETNYLNLGYQYLKGEDKDNDTDYIPFIPEHQANAGLNIQLLEKLNLNTQCKYVSSQPREKEDLRSDLKAYTTVDTTFNYQLMGNARISLSIYNLFDEEDIYSPSLYGNYPQSDLHEPGRKYSLATRFNF